MTPVPAETLSYIDMLGPWVWFILGLVLLIGELVAPGAFLLWLGLAALITGLVALTADMAGTMAWQWQLMLFAGLAIIAVVVGRILSPRPGTVQASDRPFLNRRAEALVGRRFVLDEPIAAGIGRIRVDDTIWRIAGEDAVAGATVIVERVDGATLHVFTMPIAGGG